MLSLNISLSMKSKAMNKLISNFFSLVLHTAIVLGTACSLLLPFAKGDTELDVQSLLAFKRGITHDPLQRLQNWYDNSSNACNWKGVTCSSKHQGRVIELQLDNANLQGKIAPEIGNLSFLQYLILSANNFTGGIPPSIGRLHRLQFLNVSENNDLGGVIPSELSGLYNLRQLTAFKSRLSGPIPPSLGNCSQLQTLHLGGNKLIGSIPDTFGSLANIIRLHLGANALVGSIPSSLVNCSKLQHLNLYSNKLSGSIPPNLGLFPSLKTLSLAFNSLTGTIPDSIGNVTTLEEVELLKNNLHGSLPPSLGSLSKLEWLAVWNNSLTGTIPSSLCNATSLAYFILHFNKLHGTVPLCMARLPNLQAFQIPYNNFESGLKDSRKPIPILEAFSNSSTISALLMGANNFRGTLPLTLPASLTQFAIEENFITGVIPERIGNLSNLMILSVGGNSLQGIIPTTIGLMKSLQEFSIQNNLLEGNIPREIAFLNQSLNYLNLNGNRFSSSIPVVLGELTSLRKLDLSMNSFSGSIPKQLGKCSNLEYLDLSSNNLSSKIPAEVAGLRNIQTMFSLSKNMLSGEVIGMQLPMAEIIDLSHNHLLGKITTQMTQWLNAKIIDLSTNNFSGIISESVGAKLPMLQSINLSNNNFSGAIPQSMYGLSALNFLNFSYNNFEGIVFCRGAFRHLNNQSFLHNPLLCGGCLNLTECIRQKNEKLSFVSNKKYIILVVSLVIVAVICVAVLLFYLMKKSNESTEASLMEANAFMVVSEEEVIRTTCNFSLNNLLGQGSHGSVYAGVLANGDPVAIKIFSETRHKSSFMRECQILGRVRHRNLIKIITVCCTENLTALIMPLMPKGNLHNLLHEKDSNDYLCTLSLKSRMRILQELATGLSYLHHHHTPPIVHCDIKPENVLLDYDFTVKLSDFGIAKLLSNHVTIETSNLRGTIGYIAPEYGTGEVSVKGDIYSFGVVLLELMTRMKPTDAMFTGNLNLCNWIEMAFDEDVKRVQLKAILNLNSGLDITDEEEWTTVERMMRVGMACCSHVAEERPSMHEVEGLLALLCGVKNEERIGPGKLDALLASSVQPIRQVSESDNSSTFE